MDEYYQFAGNITYWFGDVVVVALYALACYVGIDWINALGNKYRDWFPD